MSKLISNPRECGFRRKRAPLESPHIITRFVCMNSNGTGNCDYRATGEFPTNCPLQDGEPSERYYGGVRSGANTPKDKPKRRNRKPARSRKDCIHIEEHNGCSAPFVDRYYCIGVNCGRFEPKN